VRDADGPREVGDEDERAAEDGDEDEVAPRAVPGNLDTEFIDPSRDLVPRQVDIADPGVVDYVRWLSPYFCARRSKSRR
jgi:hypothetical protein